MTGRIAGLLHRHGRVVLAAGFGLLLALQIALHAPLVEYGAPYEGWDEVTTYNGTRVLAGRTADWIYRYGTLDSLLQLIGLDYFLTFDPLGAEYRHIAYSNNDPQSLNDEFYAFRRIQPTELGYAYFRGIDDHRPIALSRWLHFDVFYGLVALTGLFSIWLLGWGALWLILPMLCLTVDTEVFGEAIETLPNAINAVLCFAIVAAIGLAGVLRRGWLLNLAAGLLATAINFKIDVMPLGLVLGLALLLHDRPAGLRPLLRRCAVASGIFLAALVATDPLLVFNPSVPLKWLFPPVNATSTMTTTADRLATNLGIFLQSLHRDLLPELARDALPVATLPIAALLALAIILYVLRHRLSLLRPAVLLALGVLMLWLAPLLLAQDYYPRYEMNGVAALFALTGIVLTGIWRGGGVSGRQLAIAGAALLLGQYGLKGADGARLAQQTADSQMVLWGAGNRGWAEDLSRNTVEQHAVATYLAGGYSGTVLVDQHGYLDLRPLRLAGMTPVFVNMDTLETVLPTLDPAAPHLLLYSPGSYTPDPSWWRAWMLRWPPEVERRYDAYRAALAAYPVLFDTGGPPQRLLWTGPVDPRDRMVLAAVPARTP